MQCIKIDVIDDDNVLEEVQESFQLNLTAFESSIIIPHGQDSIVIDIYEDPGDSESI